MVVKYCLKGKYKNNSKQRPEKLNKPSMPPERAQQLQNSFRGILQVNLFMPQPFYLKIKTSLSLKKFPLLNPTLIIME
jgi:hypothetical protein